MTESVSGSDPSAQNNAQIKKLADGSSQTEVTVYHIEMLSEEQHVPKSLPHELTVVEAEIQQAPVNRFLYQFVGTQWHWRDKLSWSDERWREYAEDPNLRTWIGYSSGSIVGYFELQKQPQSTIELKYFGLVPGAIGKGFGGGLLSYALDMAWQWGSPQRVWAHTCTTDHPHALANYQSRGFSIFKSELFVD